MVCVGMSSDFNLSRQILSVSSLTAGSPRESPALAAQLRAFYVISSSLRAELSTSRNHSVGKVSAFADVFSVRSHPLTVCQRYCGRRRLLSVTIHLRNVCPGEARSSTLHRRCGQRSAARHSLWAGQARTPLRFRSIASAPDLPEKEVRLRLVLFDARYILSGSVVHFVTDTSSEGERRRETVTAAAPLLCTPSLPDSQSGIAPLTLRSLSCRACTLQGLQFLRYGYGISADCTEPILVSSPFTAPIPPPPLRHPSPFRRPGSHVRSALPFLPDSTICARAGKTVVSRPDRRTVRLLPRLSACLLDSPEDRKNDADASPFPTSCESSGEYPHAPMSVHSGTTSHAGSVGKEYIHKQQEALSCFCNSHYQHCIPIRYIGDCHQYTICHLCG